MEVRKESEEVWERRERERVEGQEKKVGQEERGRRRTIGEEQEKEKRREGSREEGRIRRRGKLDEGQAGRRKNDGMIPGGLWLQWPLPLSLDPPLPLPLFPFLSLPLYLLPLLSLWGSWSRVPSSAGKRSEGFSRRGTAIHCTLHRVIVPNIHIHRKWFKFLVCGWIHHTDTEVEKRWIKYSNWSHFLTEV